MTSAAGPSASTPRSPAPDGGAPAPRAVGFAEAFRFWLKLGFINFGGPAGQIAIMHQELVERRRWIGHERFLHALNFCMLLPGPEAQQLAIYIGWLLHGTRGGLVAGTLFVLPAAVIILVLSWVYVRHGQVGVVAAAFYGLRAAVVAIVAAALLRIGARALRLPGTVPLAAAAFVLIFFFEAPFPAIVFGAGLVGLVLGRRLPTTWGRAAEAAEADGERVVDAAAAAAVAATGWRRPARVLVTGLLVWWLPLALVMAWLGRDHVISREAVFFSKAAMVTFGGAYAVLAYLQQAAVESYGWLTARQMLDGLGLAETTPGPLILVTQFVGFLAAWGRPGPLSPLAAGVLGSAVTVWATFVPCFLWIFLGAPYVERLRSYVPLRAALAAITAAVVGVILNLAVWLGLNTLFGAVGEKDLGWLVLPTVRFSSLDFFSLAVAAIAFVGLWRLRWGLVPVVLGSAAAGLVRLAITG